MHRHQPRGPGPLGRAQPEPRRGGHQERLLRARDLAGDAARRHRRSAPTTARAPGTTYEKISQLKPVFRPNGTMTAGNACPLNDGAAAVVIMSDTKAKELGLTPLARIVSTGVSAGCRRRSWAWARSRRSRRRWRDAGMSICRHRPVRDQRGVRRAGARFGPRAGHGRGQAQRVRRRDRAGSPVRHDGCAHHRHAAEQPARPTTRRSASRRCASAAARAWRWSWSDCPEFCVECAETAVSAATRPQSHAHRRLGAATLVGSADGSLPGVCRPPLV